ncbi:MAG: hypothetical protein ACKOOE_06195 [Micrococcales bacterium]
MNKNVRLGLVLPLVGVTVAWVAMVVAAYLDLGLNFYNGSNYSNFVEVKVSTYLVLLGLAIASGLALWGFKKADVEHSVSDSVPLVRAVYRFGGLMVVLALVFDAIFALTTFLTSLDLGMAGGVQTTLGGRLLGVYLPIVLDAALVVFVLLQATLWRKSSAVEGSADSGLSSTQKALAIGYALPILGTALAIIVGLVFYDIQKSSIQNWTWVVIQLLIGTSIVLGTRFAAKAKAAKPVVRAPRVVGAAGAVTLNYVLSLVFAGAVSLMSFSFAISAVNALAGSDCDVNGSCKFLRNDMTSDWWVNQMIPAFLLLVSVQVAVYLVITSRNKEVSAA